ncbi:S-adenosyl-L-methionine-dependent methyltransferase, partial [Thamnocephalis sphaerospora]
INGRNYANIENTVYHMPCDTLEMDRRLDAEHYMIRQVTGTNAFAPIEKMTRCIDIGTGSGIWVLEMASENPQGQFLGVDIMPPHVSELKPPNCRFERGNLLEGLAYSDNTFDYVHHRCLNTAMPETAWQAYVDNCARICAPGGWVEMVETTGMLWNVAGYGERFNSWMHQLANPQGIDLFVADRVAELLQRAHLGDIRTHQYMLPVGAWAGAQGELGWQSVSGLVNTLAPFLEQNVGVSPAEVAKLLKGLKAEVAARRSYLQLKIYCARKPTK